jgi:ferredoxin--NADP+ reductase
MGHPAEARLLEAHADRGASDAPHDLVSDKAVSLHAERVTSVRHWNARMFSFSTTRGPGLCFRNGQFLMLGLPIAGQPLMRAYSVVSANHEEHLEFLCRKIPGDPLTARLHHLQPGDEVLVNGKPSGTLVADDLLPGRRLYLFAAGTGIAPFLSIVKDPEVYRRFERVVLVHSVRRVADLAYRHYLAEELPHDELLGELAQEKLVYYPTVTGEPFRHEGRITLLVESGRLGSDLGLPALDGPKIG